MNAAKFNPSSRVIVNLIVTDTLGPDMVQIPDGYYGVIGNSVDAPFTVTPGYFEAQVSAERNRLLEQYVKPYTTDLLVWNNLNNGQTQALQVYRSQLLDIEQQPGYPINVVWPTPPQIN
jgi:hypothetical protein